MSEGIPLPLAAPLGTRYESLTVDSRLVNCFVEESPVDKLAFVYKRPGFNRSVIGSRIARAQGIFNWRNHLYSIAGGILYKDGVNTGYFVDDTGYYSFYPTLGATPILFFTNGVQAYRLSTADAMTGVTLNMTTAGSGPIATAWLPDCVYLDGYLFVFGVDSQLWNSEPNNASSWQPLSHIYAQMESDSPIALHKHLSYILAIKEFYTEAFYDAGNPAGSPLAPVNGAKMNFGCVDGRTVAECGGEVMWVARTREGSVSVIIVSNMKAQPVSTPQVERLLQAADYSGNVYSWSAKVDGHRFYGVTVVNSNITLVYDITSRFWYQWTDPNGNYLPYAFSTIDTNNKVVFQHESEADLYHLDITHYTDEDSVFAVDIYTPNYDGGTRRYKTLAKANLHGDQAQGAVVELEYSDDDYQTWKSAGSADLGSEDPFWSDLGSFKKRAFHLRHQAPTPFRVRMLEAFIAAGDS